MNEVRTYKDLLTGKRKETVRRLLLCRNSQRRIFGYKVNQRSSFQYFKYCRGMGRKDENIIILFKKIPEDPY